MNRQKAVLWDLGNVVVRWEPEAILSSFKYGPAETDFLRRELLGHSDWLKLDQGLITEQQVADRLSKLSTLSSSEIHRCFDVVRESLNDIQESVSLIEQMHGAGIPMYVLSNMSNVNARFLRQRPYFQHFNGVVISAEEKLIKPDPELFQRVLDRYKLKAQSVYFIDDSSVNIETALTMGFYAQHFHRSTGCYQKIKEVFGLT